MAELYNDIKERMNSNEVEKFNPFHDGMGRFCTGPNAKTFTYKPGKSVAHNRAIAREVVRTGKLGSGVRMVGTRVDEDSVGTNVYSPKTDEKGEELIGNAIRQYNRSEKQSLEGRKQESARERKNRLAREKRAQKNSNVDETSISHDSGVKVSSRKVASSNRKQNPVYNMLRGNKRPKKKKAK